MKKKMLGILAMAIVGVIGFTGCAAKPAGQSAVTKDTLIMGTNAEFPPFEYREGNEVKGFDADLANRIGEKLGKKVTISDMGFDGLIPALNAGKIDFIAAGMTVTDERKQNVDFTEGYYTASQVIIVQKEGSKVQGAEDLKGKKIGVQLGTTGDIEASKIEGAQIVQFDKAFTAIMELQKGGVDAVVLDSEPARNFVSHSADLEILADQLTEEEYAIAVKKGDKELVEAFNKALKEIKEDGSYDALIEKHMGK